MVESNVRNDESGGPGCLLVAFLIGIAAIGAGVYLLSRWETLPGLGKAGAIVLVVIGTLMSLPMIVFWGIQIFLKRMLRGISTELGEAGQQIIRDMETMYGQIHEFRDADEDDFEGLNESFYQQTERQLTGLGWRRLGDVVDETIEQIKEIAVPIRIMASPDGTVVAGFYHLVSPEAVDDEGEPRMDLLMCDVSTEYSDGTFQHTANNEDLDATTPPPRLVRRQFPLDTPVADLLRAHESEKQKQLAARAGVTCVVINTLDEALESEKRQQQAKNEFRRQIGYVDPEEVRRIGAMMEDGGEVGDMVARAVEEEKRKRAAGES